MKFSLHLLKFSLSSHIINLKKIQYQIKKRSLTTMDNNRSKTIKYLAALDFDDTIANANTDLIVRDLIAPSEIPNDVVAMYKTTGWIPYMQEIFKLLHSSGINNAEITKAIQSIPAVPAMVKCIKSLKSLVTHDFDLIIISDSNSFFIRTWCEHYGIQDDFKQVFTNPAKFNENTDLLEIQPFHRQTECNLSSENLCKGKVLQDFIEFTEQNENVSYKKVFYVGDGGNDFCPILKLNSHDYGCPRIGFNLDRKLLKLQEDEPDLLANRQIMRWTDGSDLFNSICLAIK